jgi:hypothetical protein
MLCYVVVVVFMMMMMTVQWNSIGANMAYYEKSVYNDMLTMYHELPYVVYSRVIW